jgi:choline kinase
VRAIVLAAGRGSRMETLTSDRPKCLIEVNGACLLDRQTASLQLGGANEIGIVTGWQADRFRNMPYQFFHNPRWQTSSMVDSLACASSWLSEDVVVSYSDIVFSPHDVTALVECTKAAAITIAYDPAWSEMWNRRFVDPLSDAETFKIGADGYVTDIGRRPKSVAEIEGQYIGLLAVQPSGWKVIHGELLKARQAGERSDMTALLGRLAAKYPRLLRGIPIEGPWHEFDSVSDMRVGLDSLRAVDSVIRRATSARPSSARTLYASD